ncbi:MAG TPA: UDP-N-acetylmuramoyl-L-alanyl-D-glutamate--2,6-diaminopimelate ligase [Phycisphaerales bacterium]|nr:UDP-N-acetylmuramoyl-L-alanyl-D-glutamate--2,6-diaminopimelate ligase [Phycisphaerales bacterium]
MTFTQLLALVQSQGERIGLCADSRQVRPGDVFVAVPGAHVDGHDYIDQAVKKGARYVVSRQDRPVGAAELVVVADTAAALGELAQARVGYPARSLCNLAVTGTNGKTTVAWLVRSVVQSAGAGCGLIGTIQYDTGDGSPIPAPLTTPDAIELARLGRETVDAGAAFMVAEASSHALDQNRLAGVDFTAAAFTNLSGDHLDYHKTEEDYLAAKARLFMNLPIHAVAVLNRQSPHAARIAELTRCRIFWYAIDEPADLWAAVVRMDAHGTHYVLHFGNKAVPVATAMVGAHNVANHLAAAGLCLAAGFDLETVGRGLAALQAVPGRLEPVNEGQDFQVLVDYAHTDDALRNVLTTLRPLCRGRLIVVFGCGGDRDRTKRPRMARVAELLADRIVVTSDNPRTEDPRRIIEEIRVGFSDAGAGRVTVEPDRRAAIETALREARAGDVVLIAGKGHEDYQILGTERIHFDDREVAGEVLRTLL